MTNSVSIIHGRTLSRIGPLTQCISNDSGRPPIPQATPPPNRARILSRQTLLPDRLHNAACLKSARLLARASPNIRSSGGRRAPRSVGAHLHRGPPPMQWNGPLALPPLMHSTDPSRLHGAGHCWAVGPFLDRQTLQASASAGRNGGIWKSNVEDMGNRHGWAEQGDTMEKPL